MYRQVSVHQAIYGTGENLLLCGNGLDRPPEVQSLLGQIQGIYLDPPFRTGEVFARKRVYGEKGWRKGTPALTVRGYSDRFPDDESYLELLEGLIRASRDLLKQEGVFCLHLDWRMSVQARALCDKVFGKDRFLNEIIWAYESGGRSRRYFPRKHDTILIYARSKHYTFDLSRVPLPRSEVRKNHMARGVDEYGRSYSRIRAHGKEYRYYDDDPVYPGDVWTDIGFLQQKDPERTGYPTQKPVRLVERLLRPVTQPGDRVADLCCGSGTVMAAAEKMGCSFLGMDLNPEAIAVTQARLHGTDLRVVCDTAMDGTRLRAEMDEKSGRLRLFGMEFQGECYPPSADAWDLVESWETGRVEGKTFLAEKRFQRTNQFPGLTESLNLGTREVPDLLLTDAAGIRRAYRWEKETGG